MKVNLLISRSTTYDKLEETAPRFFPRKDVCMTSQSRQEAHGPHRTPEKTV